MRSGSLDRTPLNSMLSKDANVVLIGMPGVGKSTVGRELAEALDLEFLDTDATLQEAQGRRLSEILRDEGIEGFCRLEERHVLSLEPRGCVIATGGSVVYSPAAMAHLKRDGVVVWLKADVEDLERRIGDPDERGVVRRPGQTLRQLYEERVPLYARYADLTVRCDEPSSQGPALVRRIIAQLKDYGCHPA